MDEKKTPSLTGEVETPVRWLVVATFFFIITFSYLMGSKLAKQTVPVTTSTTAPSPAVVASPDRTTPAEPVKIETDGFVETERIEPVNGQLPPPPNLQ